MSTGLECVFYQVGDREWFYVLENSDAPKNAFDWREYATAYGPFVDEATAERHLDRHHANPGGSHTEDLRGAKAVDETLVKLFEEARKRAAAPRRW